MHGAQYDSVARHTDAESGRLFVSTDTFRRMHPSAVIVNSYGSVNKTSAWLEGGRTTRSAAAVSSATWFFTNILALQTVAN